MIRRRLTRGYTIVELMMAISVMAIGVTGIIAMQKVTMSANQNAKHLAVATQIAGAWLDALAADALQWNSPSTAGGMSDLNQTNWLDHVDETWFRPEYDDQMLFGPGFDGLGTPLSLTDMDNAVYCTHLRLSWLFPEVTNVSGNGLIRAEVRVFWLREGGPGSETPVCSDEGVEDTIGGQIDRYHFVYQTGAIRQNTL